MSGKRKYEHVIWENGGREKGGRVALPLPSFFLFYFLVRAFSISWTWLSRSLQQALITRLQDKFTILVFIKL